MKRISPGVYTEDYRNVTFVVRRIENGCWRITIGQSAFLIPLYCDKKAAGRIARIAIDCITTS